MKNNNPNSELSEKFDVPHNRSVKSPFIVSLGTAAAFSVLAVPPLTGNPDFLPDTFHSVVGVFNQSPEAAVENVLRTVTGVAYTVAPR